MSTLPAWAAGYIGIPYRDKGRSRDGIDCWGIVRLVYREVFNTPLPDYSECYRNGEDWPAIADAIETGLKDGWTETKHPRAGDMVTLKIGGRPWHCGVMLDTNWFMHAAPGDSVVCDELRNDRWKNRIEGIYRHD